MRNIVAICLLLTGLPSFAVENFCDTGKPHLIDVWAAKENEKTGGVSVKVREVQSNEYNLWDKELNQIYSALQAKLNDQDKKRLKEAQKAWLKYRDTEIDWYWSQAMYGNEESSAPIIVAGIGIEMVKKRVCDLTKFKVRADDAY